MEKVLIVLGIVFLGLVVFGIICSITRAVKMKKGDNLGKLYFKQWPNGSRSFHLALDVDLDKIKEGEVYTITVKEEQPTEAEKQAIKEIMED